MLRELPSVDETLSGLSDLAGAFPHRLIVAEIRAALDQARHALRSGTELPDIEGRTRDALAAWVEAIAPLVMIKTPRAWCSHTLGRALLGPRDSD